MPLVLQAKEDADILKTAEDTRVEGDTTTEGPRSTDTTPITLIVPPDSTLTEVEARLIGGFTLILSFYHPLYLSLTLALSLSLSLSIPPSVTHCLSQPDLALPKCRHSYLVSPPLLHSPPSFLPHSFTFSPFLPISFHHIQFITTGDSCHHSFFTSIQFNKLQLIVYIPASCIGRVEVLLRVSLVTTIANHCAHTFTSPEYIHKS